MEDNAKSKGSFDDTDERKPYRTPTLARLGKVSEVTQSGSGALTESGALYSQ